MISIDSNKDIWTMILKLFSNRLTEYKIKDKLSRLSALRTVNKTWDKILQMIIINIEDTSSHLLAQYHINQRIVTHSKYKIIGADLELKDIHFRIDGKYFKFESDDLISYFPELNLKLIFHNDLADWSVKHECWSCITIPLKPIKTVDGTSMIKYCSSRKIRIPLTSEKYYWHSITSDLNKPSRKMAELLSHYSTVKKPVLYFASNEGNSMGDVLLSNTLKYFSSEYFSSDLENENPLMKYYHDELFINYRIFTLPFCRSYPNSTLGRFCLEIKPID